MREVVDKALDRYVLVERLAEGGMGAIFLGRRRGDPATSERGEAVVLKQLLPAHTHDATFIELFEREARLTAALRHPNIVRTLDLVSSGGDYFIVMEHVDGADLRTLIKRLRLRQRRFSVAAALFVARRLLEALRYAHARRDGDGRPLTLIHRDISPSNILVSGAGAIKLTDFGIAKVTSGVSAVFEVKGKVGYMAPEQARGEAIDARADLFAVGVVLWEALIGERLFVGGLFSSVAQIYSQPILPPSQLRDDVPPDLDLVVARALCLDPAGRFQSAAEFAAALDETVARRRLALDEPGLASFLREAAGADPAEWRRPERVEVDTTEQHAVQELRRGDALGEEVTGAVELAASLPVCPPALPPTSPLIPTGGARPARRTPVALARPLLLLLLILVGLAVAVAVAFAAPAPRQAAKKTAPLVAAPFDEGRNSR